MNQVLNDLISKVRVGWEKNGFEDGLKDKVRLPTGSTFFTTDSYKKGWYDGEQVRKIKENEYVPSQQQLEAADD